MAAHADGELEMVSKRLDLDGLVAELDGQQ